MRFYRVNDIFIDNKQNFLYMFTNYYKHNDIDNIFFHKKIHNQENIFNNLILLIIIFLHDIHDIIKYLIVIQF